MRKHRTHRGVIAYRLGKKKTIEILLIRSRGAIRWMIPKGHEEKHLSARELALKEAWEEGGMMKEFYLIRHGKSIRSGGAERDFDRPLSKRGQRDSSAMGERLARMGLKPDLIISSPAARAALTAGLIAAELNYPEQKIRYDDNLYLCDVQDFQNLLQALDEKIGKVIVVAHNPGIQMAEYYFSGVDREKIPTCAICAFEAGSWKQVKRKSCREIYYDYPKNVLH